MRHPFGTLKTYQLPDGKPLESVGEPERAVWILLRQEDMMEGENLELLEKIFNAIKIDLKKDAYQIAIDPNDPIQLSDLLIPYPSGKTIISFGIWPVSLGLSIEQLPYQPFTLRQVQFLFSHDLSSISSNPELKRSLWGALQNLPQASTS